MFCLFDNMRFRKSFVSGQYLCSFSLLSSYSLKNFAYIFAYFVVYFLVFLLMTDLLNAVLRHGIMQLL